MFQVVVLGLILLQLGSAQECGVVVLSRDQLRQEIKEQVTVAVEQATANITDSLLTQLLWDACSRPICVSQSVEGEECLLWSWMHTQCRAFWTAHLQSGCGKWLTLEVPCGLTTIPEITVDNSPDSEIEVDAVYTVLVLFEYTCKLTIFCTFDHIKWDIVCSLKVPGVICN